MKSEIVICTIAKPTHDIFPTANISQALQYALQRVEKVEADCFYNFRNQLLREKEQGQISENAYELRLAEIRRNQQRYGNLPTIAIDGMSIEGIRIAFTVGEQMIVARLMEVILPDVQERARRVIPNVKNLISGIHPDVAFEDVTDLSA